MGGKSSKNKEKTDKGKRQTQVEEPADPNAVDYIFKLLLVGDAAVGMLNFHPYVATNVPNAVAPDLVVVVR